MEICLVGKTYEIKEALKRDGFRYNRCFTRWEKTVGDDLGEKILAGDFTAIKEAKANKRGCAVVICLPTRAAICWRSNEFRGGIRRHVSAGYYLGFDDF